MPESTDWRLRLRYGKLDTPFKHFTLIADGDVVDTTSNHVDRCGSAVLGVKVWASSSDDAFEMVAELAEKVGFELTGKIELYDTEPESPPKEKPFTYALQFTPYDTDE